jgi:hypothetical protein
MSLKALNYYSHVPDRKGSCEAYEVAMLTLLSASLSHVELG